MADKVLHGRSHSLPMERAESAPEQPRNSPQPRSWITTGRIGIFVNDAGAVRSGGLDEICEDDWGRMSEVYTKGLFPMTRAALSLAAVPNIAGVAFPVAGGAIMRSRAWPVDSHRLTSAGVELP